MNGGYLPSKTSAIRVHTFLYCVDTITNFRQDKALLSQHKSLHGIQVQSGVLKGGGARVSFQDVVHVTGTVSKAS